MSKDNVIEFKRSSGTNSNEIATYKEMEALIVEYYFYYEKELTKSGYKRKDILNDKNGAMTAMNTAIEVLLREFYGDTITDAFFDYSAPL
ncbi:MULTISPECIES: hypothetical protein [unclassified Pantoea]|uniref:hypothetical protein n=1 Tax=unclassified Pantoea TaxID=2630326 RepID=UPI0012319F27|nr:MULTISPECIES: hypothetical protein [unclassified Pantoea]KAA6101383.1 hypothetical protein F3I21_07165 [Pantoea sp. B_9]KAA6109642.1 hypothetical protein F3I18_18935 [Pantoea sp. B_10]